MPLPPLLKELKINFVEGDLFKFLENKSKENYLICYKTEEGFKKFSAADEENIKFMKKCKVNPAYIESLDGEKYFQAQKTICIH